MDNPGLNEKWHALSIENVFGILKSGRPGLSSAEAKNRLSAYGFNELPEKKKIETS